MRKQIAGALVASVLMGSMPVWAEDGVASPAPAVQDEARRQQLRDSIDRAVDGKPAPVAAGEALTARERADLERRHAALRSDPVASGTAGIVMSLIATAASIGLTVYLVQKSKESTTTLPALGRR